MMGDIFSSSEAVQLLRNKYVVFLGDSNFRSLYKDLVQLLLKTKFIRTDHCKAKGEFVYNGDTLVEGGRKGNMHNGISYREKRVYQTEFHLIQFEFITRAYNQHVEKVLKTLSKESDVPDVVVIHSALWDVSRYGHKAAAEYKENVDKVLRRMKSLLPEETLVIWATAPPISNNPRGGLLVPEVDFLKDTLRLDVMFANAYAASAAKKIGFDVVDLHFIMRQQIHRRVKDGIHWDNTALRRMVNAFLTHIAEAWGVTLPQRVDYKGVPLLNGSVEKGKSVKSEKGTKRSRSQSQTRSPRSKASKSSEHVDVDDDDSRRRRSSSHTYVASSSRSRPAHHRHPPAPTHRPLPLFPRPFGSGSLFGGGGPIAQQPYGMAFRGMPYYPPLQGRYGHFSYSR